MGAGHQVRKTSKVRNLGWCIATELEMRQWTPRQAAIKADAPIALIHDLLAGAVITRAAAAALSRAFGSSAEIWLEAEEAERASEMKRPW
jgi:plasmid maintenance system antidote protein VapI